MHIIADGKEDVFMDHTALIDKKTGKIFLFTTLWPQNDHSQKRNTTWVTASNDHGKTWSKPVEITNDIVIPNHYPQWIWSGKWFTNGREILQQQINLTYATN